MSCLRDAWRSTIDNLKFLTMKKYFLIISAIYLSCAALMAEPVSKQKALQIASQVMDAKNGMKKAPALNTLKAIDVTIPTSLKDGVWYDLQGRRYVEKPTQHGIYILNGKKIMMK